MNANHKTMIVAACAAILLVCSGARAQQVAPKDGVTVAQGGVATQSRPSRRAGPIIGEPYSARMESVHTQTLADGTTIEKRMSAENEFRDSAGRTRREHMVAPVFGHDEEEEVISILIQDPTTGVAYTLDTHRKTARKLSSPAFVPVPQNNGTRLPTTQPMRQVNGDDERPRPKITTENLGTQEMEGLTVTGTRTTTEYPTGLVGNDRPFSVVTERWFSEELQIEVLARSTDPRSGETVTRMTNLDRSEPDPSLFQVPADYTITREEIVNADQQ